MSDSLEKQIKAFFEARRPAAQAGAWPEAAELAAYLSGSLEGLRLEQVENRIERDAELRIFVGEMKSRLSGMSDAEGEEVPAYLIGKAKGLMSGASRAMHCPHCHKAITPFKKPLSTQKAVNAFWFTGLIASFGLSFVFPRYFMQFLISAILFGLKWIWDSKATRTQIYVYKALSEEAETPRVHDRGKGVKFQDR